MLVENTRYKHLRWVRAIMSYKGWSQTELARQAGVDPSTLSRFFREVNPGAMLQSHTIEKIARVGGIPPFREEPPEKPRGYSAGEAARYGSSSPDPLILAAIAGMRETLNNVDPWQLNSSALEYAGYSPGDVLIVDPADEPENGDIVLAYLPDPEDLSDGAIFRIYEDPYLVAATRTPHLQKPLHIVRDQVRVAGVVVASLRGRRIR